MRQALVVAMATLGALTLTGCGAHASSSTPRGTRLVAITVADGRATPSGAVVVVRRGQSVELDIHADDSGSLQVHSTPEKTIEYHAGTTQASLGPLLVPGRIAVRLGTSPVVMLRVR
jgi:hypothetical protein